MALTRKERSRGLQCFLQTRDKRDFLATRGFVHGLKVDATSLKDFQVTETFGKIGWDTFLNLSGPAMISHIREFYTGYTFIEDEGMIQLQMYDKFYTLSLDQFCTILQLPRAETRIYTTLTNLNSISKLVSSSDLIGAICQDFIKREKTKQISQQSLLENVKVWNKIVVANIFPRGGNTDRLAALQAYLLYCLVKGVKVDVGYIVAKRMDEISITNRKLPYGLLLNRLFHHLNLPGCCSESADDCINASTIRPHDHVHVDVDTSMDVDVDVDVDDEVEIEEDWRSGFEDRFTKLEKAVDYTRIYINELEEQLDYQSDLIRQIWERFPQVPPSPSSSDDY